MSKLNNNTIIKNEKTTNFFEAILKNTNSFIKVNPNNKKIKLWKIFKMSLREYKKNINDVKSIEDYNKLIKNLTDVEQRAFSLNVIDHIISKVDLTYFDFNDDKLNELLSFLILKYE